MYDTHSPAEWAAAFCLATGVFAAASVPYFLLVDADRSDFDPRPLLARSLAAQPGDRLLVEIVRARCTARDALVAVALHLSPAAAPKGALR